ncbi:class I SAM-dependent DNA methyltransferase [Streptomonospora arabica]|uniref:Class I SAM-dependent DNA methyltransferase n=1 Tax=Streptomonospora arabica TaxID=412417 RepID=A0ABV9SR05_9ACTN
MHEHADHFGEDVAAAYDDPSDAMFQPRAVEATADVLHRLAAGKAALELGIGTGRIALPLARRGVAVHGIDLSEAMVARLRAKPGSEAIGVTIGDFATARAPGRYSLVYLVFNTIMNLTSQDAQVDCFANAAEHLEPGGRFVVEAGVPGLRLLPPGQNVVHFATRPARLAFDVYDTATQSMSSNYVEVSDDGHGSCRSIPFRYVWPAELDLMARMAGLRLAERWSGWSQEPFTHESTEHVSVWEKPAA